MKTQNKIIVEPIPSWALCAVINGDYTGLTDEDIKMIEDWYAQSEYNYIWLQDAESYFTHYPAFGLPCDVYDCVCETI